MSFGSIICTTGTPADLVPDGSYEKFRGPFPRDVRRADVNTLSVAGPATGRSRRRPNPTHTDVARDVHLQFVCGPIGPHGNHVVEAHQNRRASVALPQYLERRTVSRRPLFPPAWEMTALRHGDIVVNQALDESDLSLFGADGKTKVRPNGPGGDCPFPYSIIRCEHSRRRGCQT